MQRKKSDDVSDYPDCLAHAKRVMEGLRSVHVVVGTSLAHSHDMESVLALFRAAMNYRHEVWAVKPLCTQRFAGLEDWRERFPKLALWVHYAM
jgi:hypothetical protein